MVDSAGWSSSSESRLLVGRTREQAILRQCREAALAGQGSLLLVAGEAGIGKTTLVEQLSREAETGDMTVVWGRAYDLSVTPPYGPWLEMLRQCSELGGNWPAPPDFVSDVDALPKFGSEDTLFAAIAGYFHALADYRPLMLVLDDIHWADQASLDFLRSFARRIADHRILLVAIHRSDELHREHPLFSLLPLLVREAQAVRLDVRPLDEVGQRELIRSHYHLTAGDQRRLEEYLQTHAEGNPLYAGELLRSLEEEGVLISEGGEWRVGDLKQVRVPSLLRQVIERRLSRLGEETRQLLQVAAVIGQDVPLKLWQVVSSASDGVLTVAIEEGQRTHLIEETSNGRSYRFHHALLREALYQEVVAIRRRAWHRQVAEVLAETPSPDSDVVAHHFQQAGDVRAVAWLLESARRARMTYATATAVERLETALALDEQHDGASGLRGWLLAALVGLGELLAHVDECRSMLDEAMSIAGQSNDAALVALVEWYRAYIEINWSAPVGEMLGNARDSIRALPPGERERLFGFIYGASGAPLDPSGPGVTYVVIGFLAQSGQYRQALADIERVRAGHPGLSAAAEQGIENALMVSYQALGRPDDALPCYERLLTAYRRDKVSDWAAVVMWLKLRDLVLVYWPDRIALRQSVADETVAAVRLAKAEQTFSQQMPDEVGIIWLLLLDGRWDDARRVVEEAADRWSNLMTAATWMNLSRHEGEPEVALAQLPVVFPDGPASRPGRTTFETSVYCMHPAIEIALDAGDLATARAWLECHDRWMAWSGNIPLTTIGHCLWARYHRVAGNPSAARERADQTLALATKPRQPLALLAVHRQLGELDTEGGAYGSAQQHLDAALALAEACRAPFERALTLVTIAELALVSGDADAAGLRLADARAICEPLEARPTLARIDALAEKLTALHGRQKRYPAGLTARQIEVLRLVSEGLSDAEVAERLYLSRRTVSTHLTAIYGKLNVSSRAAATRFAVEHGLV